MKNFKFNKSHVIFMAVLFTLGVAGIITAFSGQTSPTLGTADSFSILAKTSITNIPTSSIDGDVGLDNAGSNYAGLTSLEVSGTIYDTNGTGPDNGMGENASLMTSARADSLIAFGALSASPNAICDVTYAGTKDLAGMSLVPGIYCADEFSLSGVLTLDGILSSDVWIFRSAAALNTSSGNIASVVFTPGDASACNVWWKVVSSATLGTGTDFVGNILAATSVTLQSGASLNGRAFAYTGAVTLANSTISGCAVPLDPPYLTLNKEVSGGGAEESEWTLTATGPTDLTGLGASGTTDVQGDVAVGTYTLSESGGSSNYDASSWSCTGATLTGNSITLNWGDIAVCTITSTYDAPSRVIGSMPTNTVVSTTTSTPEIIPIATTIIPSLPKTGFGPQEGSSSWISVTISNIINWFK